MDNNLKTPKDLHSIREQLEEIDEQFVEPFSSQTTNSTLAKEKEKRNKIVFAISLKSKKVSHDWSRVQTSLSRTIRSILRNTDQNFQILVAGHEKPEISELQHYLVKWLPVDFLPPTGPGQFSSDKMHKRRVMGAYLREKRFSGYFMPLDADDWIHYRFVEFIRSRPLTDAFILKKGVIVNLMRREAWIRDDRFYIGCGSSAIYYFSKRDFPRSTRKKEAQRKPFSLVLKPHGRVMNNLEELNKEYTMVHFPFVTWVLGHGDNNSMLKGKKDNQVSAANYKAIGEEPGRWFFDYFRVKKRELVRNHVVNESNPI